jgi:hypothetical protein
MSLLQEIQEIRALTIRNPVVSADRSKKISQIHACIMSGADPNGWKRVEWRNTRREPQKENRKYYRDSIPLVPKKDDGFETVHRRKEVRGTPTRYVSKFTKSSENVDETILNRILLGKLNKFSKANYTEIKEFIIQIIDSGQTDMIKCFMNLVFEKAASEEVFCPLYAKLLSELSAQYPILLTEMENLYKQYMLIFEEVQDGKNEDYDQLCKRNIEKKYRRGYSQFLTELIKHGVIDGDVFIKTINTIISQIEIHILLPNSIKLIEEFADCLIKIMKGIKEMNQVNTMCSQIKQAFHERIRACTIKQPQFLGLSNKGKFAFMDLNDMITAF